MKRMQDIPPNALLLVMFTLAASWIAYGIYMGWRFAYYVSPDTTVILTALTTVLFLARSAFRFFRKAP